MSQAAIFPGMYKEVRDYAELLDLSNERLRSRLVQAAG
jgi:hypothetical protein